MLIVRELPRVIRVEDKVFEIVHLEKSCPILPVNPFGKRSTSNFDFLAWYPPFLDSAVGTSFTSNSILCPSLEFANSIIVETVFGEQVSFVTAANECYLAPLNLAVAAERV
jgi:hypothetical protein